MALDALEPLRVAVDGIALTLLTQFKVADFTYSQAEGCRLNKAARGRFYALWAQACSQDFGGLFGPTQTNNEQQKVGVSVDHDPPNTTLDGSLTAAATEAVRQLRLALPEAVAWAV